MEIKDVTQYNAAKQYVDEIKGFYSHLVSFVVINIFLIILNFITSPNYLWFYWVLFGWGLGLVIHGFSIWSRNKLWGKTWEEKKIKEVMDKN